MQTITPKTIIAKIIAQNTNNIKILENARLHCLYCPWSTMETLEQGAKAHNWSKKKMQKIIDKLNNNEKNAIASQ